MYFKFKTNIHPFFTVYVCIFQFKFDAQLLLVKINYCRGNYTGAYALLDKAGIDQVTVISPSIRFLRILAEGYAIKGEFR